MEAGRDWFMQFLQEFDGGQKNLPVGKMMMQ
jgi:hypothetical protein